MRAQERRGQQIQKSHQRQARTPVATLLLSTATCSRFTPAVSRLLA